MPKLSRVIATHIKAVAQAHMDLDVELREVWHSGIKIVVTTGGSHNDPWFMMVGATSSYDDVYRATMEYLYEFIKKGGE